MSEQSAIERRRSAVLRHPTLNGIAFVEVIDTPDQPDAERQRRLVLHFLKPLGGRPLNRNNLRVEGGERVQGITVLSVSAAARPEPDAVEVRVDRPGDFSRYTLRLVRSPQSNAPPEGFDALLSAVEFSFKVNCPDEFDCATASAAAPPEPIAEPPIDYMAKDYASFRRLMLDRVAQLVPGWREQSPAQLEVALVELLAYVGDRLSYYQDAIAAEAYLDTARRRVSVRRHARLVDYAMHDGASARVWAQVESSADLTLERAGAAGPVQLLTRVAGLPARIEPGSREHAQALAAGAEVFEQLEDVALRRDHARMTFYAWGDRTAALRRGATRATLRGSHEALVPGMVLVLGEERDPRSGQHADADPSRRHAVRLTAVAPSEDLLGALLDDPDAPPDAPPVPLTEIGWDAADALPFALCIAAETALGFRDDISVARGNIVLAEHGRSVAEPVLRDHGRERIPDPQLFVGDPPAPVPPRFRPRPSLGSVAQVAPPPAPGSPAAAAFVWRMDEVAPAIVLVDSEGVEWLPRRDLLSADRFAPAFVLEVETDEAAIRFGDGSHGRRPLPGTSFAARYRVGGGTRGNIGGGALAHIVCADPAVLAVNNPLPAAGGRASESIASVRERAPYAYTTQERAVTPDDYAALASRFPGVQRATATERWTGSWHTVFLTVDRLGGAPVDADFEADLRRYLARYRLAGHDLEVDGPRYVALEVELEICVAAGYFREQVAAALVGVFNADLQADGRRGIFHADNFSFGQPVYLSPLIAAAQTVAGVASVRALVFRRLGAPRSTGLSTSVLPMARLEIARLENDPSFPERGVLRLKLLGDK
jgi:hypothetical protein